MKTFRRPRQLPTTPRAAREAALIARGCEVRGTSMDRGDELIAGVVREAGRTLVTRNRDFERVSGLSVLWYANE
ncbi:PIN domain-containing protein [Natronorarus salvus]|uniref:hypothetical protein n=1 Tax=Natronorarus salvus TaxID=3117733 RepID=UPI002F26B151